MKGVKYMLKDIFRRLRFLFKTMATYSVGSIILFVAVAFAIIPPGYGLLWGLLGDYGVSDDGFGMLIRALVAVVAACVIAPITIGISSGLMNFIAKRSPSIAHAWKMLGVVT